MLTISFVKGSWVRPINRLRILLIIVVLNVINLFFERLGGLKLNHSAKKQGETPSLSVTRALVICSLAMSKMTPFEQAIQLYAERPDMCLSADFKAHMAMGGYVYAGPDAVAAMRPIRRDWEPSHIADIKRVEPLATADCWFVWLLCGSLKEAVKHLPCVLPWVGFAQRGQPARFIELEKALAKIG